MAEEAAAEAPVCVSFTSRIKIIFSFSPFRLPPILQRFQRCHLQNLVVVRKFNLIHLIENYILIMHSSLFGGLSESTVTFLKIFGIVVIVAVVAGTAVVVGVIEGTEYEHKEAPPSTETVTTSK